MYVSYPHDNTQQHLDVAARAIEGDAAHQRIQRGSWNGAFTAGQTQSINVSFSPVFSDAPFVYLTLGSLGTISSKVNFTASSTKTGFTLQIYSDTAQNITVNWLAIGSAE